MTGKFKEKDAERCNHYARFMQNLTLAEANTIFWLLFVIVSAYSTLNASSRYNQSSDICQMYSKLTSARY
jgi:hypothetical protein